MDKSGMAGSSQWLDLLQKGSDKERLQYCLNSDGLILSMRAIQGHSGRAKVDSTSQDIIMYQFRTDGASTLITLLVTSICTLLFTQD